MASNQSGGFVEAVVSDTAAAFALCLSALAAGVQKTAGP